MSDFPHAAAPQSAPDSASSPAPDPQPLFHRPAGLNYECIQCGRSCGEFWEIPVDPEMAARIRAVPPATLAAARDARDPIAQSPWQPGALVMRLAEGRCCLQTADGRCSLHAACGYAAKPNVCRSFPYRFIETPGGAYVGVSFACTAVLKNLGPAVADQQSELADLYAWTHSRRAVAAPLALTEDLPLSWDQYLIVEEDLAALLDPALGPIGRRLIMQSIYLRLLINFLRQVRRQEGRVGAGPEANAEPLAVFHRRMRGKPEDPWPMIAKLAARRGPSPLLRRTILGFAHALRNTYGRRRGRWASYAMAVRTYLGYACGRGSLDLPALARPVPFQEFSQVTFDPARPELDELLTRYFRHRLFRKELITGENIQTTHHLQLLHWGLIHWYSAALAAAAGRREVALDDLMEGLRNVEKYFVYHSTFDKLFTRYPLLRGALDWLFIHPLYAFSMGNENKL